MPENGSFKKIRVFLSSPGDVKAERECLKSVIAGLNQTGNIADRIGVVFEVLDWSSHVRPAMGRPQEVILNQLPVEKWDLFIGIIWVRFGTKSGEYNKETGEEFDSGTEEEFQLAYNSWKINGRPNILFYRCSRMYNPLDIDPSQFEKISGFFKRFEHSGQNPGIYRVFNDTADFERIVTQDILNYLQTIEDEESQEIEEKECILSELVKYDENIPGERIKNKLKIGSFYEISFIAVDVVGHSKLLKTYQEKDVEHLLDSIQSFIVEIVKKNNGDQFFWAGDGGIFAFWGNDAFDNSVLSGINILKELEVFNLSKRANPLGAEIRLRIAGHCGLIEYRIPHAKICADCINDVSHLEKYATNPNSFCITDRLYKKIEDRLKDTFKYIKNFESYSIYINKTSHGLTQENLENFQNEVKGICYHLSERLNIVKKSRSFDVESIRTFIEKIYISLDNFYYQYFDYDERWSNHYLQRIIDCINIVTYEEENIYNHIQQLLNESSHVGLGQNIIGLIQNVGTLRANSIPNLKILVRQFEGLLSNEKCVDEVPKEYLYEKILTLVEADEFGEDSALVEILVSEKERLIDFISMEDHDPMHEKLMQRIWNLADFVLIDDLGLPKLRLEKQSRAIFPFAVKEQKLGKFFESVIHISRSSIMHNREEVIRFLDRRGIKYRETDINIILRCLLVCTSKRELRKQVINSIDFNELWRLISYSKTPFIVIQEITEHLYHLKDGNLMKIFFDLTFSRIIHEVNNINQETTLHRLKIMIIIFYNFDFFVETSYFERLEDIRLRFITESKNFQNIRIDIFEEFAKKLEQRRKAKGKPIATIPKGIEKLPLPVQRYLAREGHYVEFFITHGHHLIALEMLRYININNIERLIRSIGRININLLRRILEKTELFKNNSVITFILNSPRCNRQFAMKHVFKLRKDELIRIAQNPNSNTDVRNYIKTLVMKKFNVKVN